MFIDINKWRLEMQKNIFTALVTAAMISTSAVSADEVAYSAEDLNLHPVTECLASYNAWVVSLGQMYDDGALSDQEYQNKFYQMDFALNASDVKDNFERSEYVESLMTWSNYLLNEGEQSFETDSVVHNYTTRSFDIERVEEHLENCRMNLDQSYTSA